MRSKLCGILFFLIFLSIGTANAAIYANTTVYNGSSLYEIANVQSLGYIEINQENFAVLTPTETLQIKAKEPDEQVSIRKIGEDPDRTIKEEDLVYTTEKQEVPFNCSEDDWVNKTYTFIGLFGKGYVPLGTGHLDKLAPLVIDSGQKHILKNGDSLCLGSGYIIEAEKIDSETGTVSLEFLRNRVSISRKVISVPKEEGEGFATWVLTLDDIGGVDNVEVLRVHISNVSTVNGSETATIDGLWLINYEDLLMVEETKFGLFEEVSVSSESITLKNAKGITLDKAETEGMVEGIELLVDESEDLSFYLVGEMPEPPAENVTIVPRYPEVKYIDPKFAIIPESPVFEEYKKEYTKDILPCEQPSYSIYVASMATEDIDPRYDRNFSFIIHTVGCGELADVDIHICTDGGFNISGYNIGNVNNSENFSEVETIHIDKVDFSKTEGENFYSISDISLNCTAKEKSGGDHALTAVLLYQDPDGNWHKDQDESAIHIKTLLEQYEKIGWLGIIIGVIVGFTGIEGSTRKYRKNLRNIVTNKSIGLLRYLKRK